MPSPAIIFLASWLRSLPWRLRRFAGPYFFVFGLVWSAYALLTVFLRPWALGNWWRIGLPVVLGFGACCLLWRPWAGLARNQRGETRRLPLMPVWLVVIAVGACTYQWLHYRLGEVRDVRDMRELGRPGDAFFFRLRGPFYLGKPLAGHYFSYRANKEKGGDLRYTATCYYACPLLAAATDTLGPPPAWLGYTYQGFLGKNLTAGEADWRYQNFVARSAARFDSLNLEDFTYLVKEEHPGNARRATRTGPLATTEAEPLLLLPVRTPFAERGNDALGLGTIIFVIGSGLTVFLLLVMPLRPGAGPGV